MYFHTLCVLFVVYLHVYYGVSVTQKAALTGRYILAGRARVAAVPADRTRTDSPAAGPHLRCYPVPGVAGRGCGVWVRLTWLCAAGRAWHLEEASSILAASSANVSIGMRVMKQGEMHLGSARPCHVDLVTWTLSRRSCHVGRVTWAVSSAEGRQWRPVRVPLPYRLGGAAHRRGQSVRLAVCPRAPHALIQPAAFTPAHAPPTRAASAVTAPAAVAAR